MTRDASRQRLLKAAVLAMALLAVGGIAGIAVTGIERVNLGARKAFHSAWLIEFHWPALLLFLLLLAGAIGGAAWLLRDRLRGAAGQNP